ncbi:metallophosphoesterase family protein [Caldichromatium japonicum]|uniref:metallophosphoesterase family protein n=1 Tax=Caldichromatium japonicum TaxID=2699430 RepID=UPI001FECA18F|nr:metallophosphoesterase family protein [Caldichromatium japonicum]
MKRVRVALLSDTHGALDPRVREVVEGCDLALHGGDIGHAAILAQLQPRLGRVLAVFGNNDVARKWPEEDRRLLVHLPEWLEQPLPGGTIALIHGHQIPARGRHDLLRARFPQARAIVYGHSHRLETDLSRLPWVLNPGAAGRSRTYGGPSCLVLIANEQDWQIETHRFPLSIQQRKSHGHFLHEPSPQRKGHTAQVIVAPGRAGHC